MSQNALDALAARLAAVEERLAALEAGHAATAQTDGLKPVATPMSGAGAKPGVEPARSVDATLIGKSILIIGGGYVLRALTEMHVLAQSAGIALGLVYALFWMFIADRALKRGRSLVALFDAATAALIASGLLWEATTRFHLLTPEVASALIVVLSAAMLAIAWRQRSTAIALIGVILASVTCIGVAIGTAHILAPCLAASILGVSTSWLSRRLQWPVYLTAIIAAASDSLALSLIVMTAVGNGRDSALALIVLIVFTVSWLIIPMAAQAVIGTLLGLGGAAIVAHVHPGHALHVGVACLVLSATTCIVALIRSRDDVLAICAAVAAFVGTILLLEPVALAVVWATAAAASAFAARRWSWDWLNVHAAVWALAAAIASGLPSALVNATDPSLVVVVVGVAATIALWFEGAAAHGSRLVLLAVITLASITVLVGGISDLMTDGAILAMTRTVVLSIAAVVLVAFSNNLREARTLAWILLIAGGVKLLLEDLRTGRAITIVVALAVYGGAMLLVARGRQIAGSPHQLSS